MGEYVSYSVFLFVWASGLYYSLLIAVEISVLSQRKDRLIATIEFELPAAISKITLRSVKQKYTRAL